MMTLDDQIASAIGAAYPGYVGATVFHVGETLRGAEVFLVIGDWLLDEPVHIPENTSLLYEPWPRSNRPFWRRVAPPSKAKAQALVPKSAGPVLKVTLRELLLSRRP